VGCVGPGDHAQKNSIERDDDSMKSRHSKTNRRALENELGQLVERVDDLQADENKGCVHQIKAKMHDGLETINL
jgi:hypothetical protein